ncbi:hypothetical protein KSF78_0004812 [Schistosoma japonicum]|nr:hypothetical protein KSF78_0004812 [Schistosoma japonicum]
MTFLHGNINKHYEVISVNDDDDDDDDNDDDRIHSMNFNEYKNFQPQTMTGLPILSKCSERVSDEALKKFDPAAQSPSKEVFSRILCGVCSFVMPHKPCCLADAIIQTLTSRSNVRRNNALTLTGLPSNSLLKCGSSYSSRHWDKNDGLPTSKYKL